MGKENRFPCPVVSRCGGCQMAHLTYAEQLRRKQAWVRELLSPFCPVDEIVGMENPFHYRNKTHAVLAGDRNGNVISGVYRMGTHQVVPVETCWIENEKADEIIATIRRLLRTFKIRPYREDVGAGLMRHVLIRTARATGQILVVLVAVKPILPRKNDFVRALLDAHPEITSIVLNVNARATSMVLGTRDIVLYGPGTIEDVLCGKTFRISPQSFYQVNSVQTERLYGRALEFANLQGKETVLDAYCGIGTIGLCAADRCGKLIGVELNPAAVRDANFNAGRNRIRNAKFLCADAGRFLLRMAAEHQPLDVLFMDPPRSGSDENFLRAVCTLAPSRVVYISCNPTTLARDLAYLTKHGYRALRATPVDMFPYTEHVETVVLMSRVEGK
ncbi:MAG: 23S rRNA (uracil(1939)-C(5))-methyltransferase RlmD [Candidatus Spyradocola sp.]